MGLIIPKLCKNLLINLTILIAIESASSTQGRQTTNKDVPKPKDDKYRPKIHFSIAEHWINDPNGMVYLDGEYHLHYQYFPEDSVWGPMHWGHSVSTDLVTWTDLPIALYPDDLGLIFSGSAVTDATNSSGFQTGSVTPIIAMFTHAGDVQAQSIAYSNDKARTFTKYEGNPVIRNPGIPDFRDPKVIRYNNEWVVVLAVGNKVEFYGSTNLKEWEFLSEFGANPEVGAHTGVWECPDLIPFMMGNEQVWVLFVSINPGGPNGGSVTQYFIGDFDGKIFSSPQTEPLWMDWGVDNYASVSFFNDPQNRAVMMGWMSNWDYANQLPTNGWRGQLTLPRVLDLTIATGQVRLQSTPASELSRLNRPDQLYESSAPVAITRVEPFYTLTDEFGWTNPLMYLDLTFDLSEFGDTSSIAICFVNGLGQEVCTGLDNGRELGIFLDRERSGLTNFHGSFARRPVAKREVIDKTIRFQVYLDVSAIELFVDSGLTCMTALFYPDEPYTVVEIRHHGSTGNLTLSSATVQGLKSMAEVKNAVRNHTI